MFVNLNLKKATYLDDNNNNLSQCIIYQSCRSHVVVKHFYLTIKGVKGDNQNSTLVGEACTVHIPPASCS